jgi:amidohydrolase
VSEHAGGASARLQIPPPLVAGVEALCTELVPRIVATRRDLCAHPELGFREVRTAALVAGRLRELGFDQVRSGVGGTGVVGLLGAAHEGPVAAIRADMDALPIQDALDTPYRSTTPHVKHACGHDAHTAMALAAADVLSRLRAQVPGRVLFLFQPAEEGDPDGGTGGAQRMIADGALSAPAPGAVFGLHVHPAIPSGSLGVNSGPAMASDATFRIAIVGRKTHGAYPHTGLDPVPIAAQVVLALQTIPSRLVDVQQPTVITVGAINGGNRPNIIADSVEMVGTVRSLAKDGQATVRARMTAMLEGITAAYGAGYELHYDDHPLPVAYNDPALCAASRPALEAAAGSGRVLTPPVQMGAEDFARYQAIVPGLFFFLGTASEAKGTTSMLHTATFDLDEDALPLGARALVLCALQFLFGHTQEATTWLTSSR